MTRQNYADILGSWVKVQRSWRSIYCKKKIMLISQEPCGSLTSNLLLHVYGYCIVIFFFIDHALGGGIYFG